jgi:polysaccharide export outer membrane protein
MIFQRKQNWKAVLLMFVAISACAQENPGKKQPVQSTTASTNKSATDDPNYIIGPQDVVEISVWKEAELSRAVPVRPDGKISLPLLDDVQAAGLTPMQLAGQIKTRLNQYMTEPQVTVIVTQTNSQRIYILGEISRTGAYALIPDMTILQAISNAGGPTAFANSKRIYLLRQENGKQGKLFFNYKEVVSGKHTEQNVLLKPGDTIVVP